MPKKLLMLAMMGLVGYAVLGCHDLLMSGTNDISDPANIDPADFVPVIDNAYFPLSPGTTYVYEGIGEDGVERIEVFIAHETKEILGVTTTVVRDTVTVDGEVVEDTYDWYAQDKDGNIWYFGEDSREYEDGEVVGMHGSWEAGVDGALPGILMLAHPQVGDVYRQEHYAGVAEDMAEVVSVTDSVSLAFGHYDHVLKTREWNPLESSAGEHKYYVLGIGLVLEVSVDGGERVQLMDIRY